MFDFLGLELYPATFLHCFLEATDDIANVHLPISLEASHATFLSLSFLAWKMEIVIPTYFTQS